jgi:hypothetical protein
MTKRACEPMQAKDNRQEDLLLNETVNEPPAVRRSTRPARGNTVEPDPALAAAVVDVLESRGPMSMRTSPPRALRRRLQRRNLTRSAAVAAEIARRVR